MMMLFTSIYGVVDGFFVSNYVGKTSFAAVNFIYPFIIILGSFGFVFGTGGSALVAKFLGEKNEDKAKNLFSLVVFVSIVLGAMIAVLGIFFIRPIAAFLGADGDMLDGAVTYGRIILLALPFYMLQLEFQSFFVTAEKPQLGLFVTLASGITNMVLDWYFVAEKSWGLVGAASATALSQVVGSVVPLFYFAFKNNSLLRFVKPSFDGKALLKVCTNGSSELMSNISMSLVGMLYNIQLIKYAVGAGYGEQDGIAAYGVLMYVNMIFLAGFIGYSVGTAPIIGYNYGAQNHSELKSILRKSFVIIGVCSVSMVVLALALASPLADLFVGYDQGLKVLTLRAFELFSLSFLFSGVAIFGSSFFTALNNGLVSAIISFMRTLVFQIAAVMLLPVVWGIDGIWFSVVVAEFMAVVMTVVFLALNKIKYNY
jgi:putative MATE family efflux protein